MFCSEKPLIFNLCSSLFFVAYCNFILLFLIVSNNNDIAFLLLSTIGGLVVFVSPTPQKTSRRMLQFVSAFYSKRRNVLKKSAESIIGVQISVNRIQSCQDESANFAIGKTNNPLIHPIMKIKTVLALVALAINSTTIMAQETVKQTAGRDQLGEFAPKFAELNDDVLFGEVWSRTDKLGLRDRSLVTLTALISQGITDSSLTYHLQTARQNGITRTETAEIITHIGFYAGWPKAWAAFRQAKEVWAEDTAADDARSAFQREMIFPVGEPNTAYAKYFIGNSYLAPVSTEQVPVANVTFEPGCRNNWHIHRATRGGGQMLIGVAGRGWYQEEGKPAVQILPGTVIHIPAGVKHWHGAAADSWFAHLAFEVPGENTSNEWLEPVSDEEYGKLK